MVRLRDLLVPHECQHCGDFNSSMVRLRVEVAKLGVSVMAGFQFQYGAIKGTDKGVTRLKVTEFQFQYGAIKGRIYMLWYFML